jgi:hypothetical protein
MTRGGVPYDPESGATQPERPYSSPPGSDAAELEPPPSHPSGFAPPPSYPPNAAPPGYPPGTPVYGDPSAATRGVSTRGLPPSYPISGAPPPLRPPPKRRRMGIVGPAILLLVMLAVIAAVVLVTTRKGGNTADASGTPQAQSVAAAATVTTAVSAIASATPTTVPATVTTPATTAALVAPALHGPTDSWTDPENRITVRFPTDWQKDTFDTRDENGTLDKAQPLLQLTGPDRVRFSVTIYVSTKTLDEDVAAFRDAGASDPKIAFKSDPTQDVTVGGEPAKLLTGSYTQNGESVAVAVWFVDHGGKRFGLSADRVGTHRSDIDAIVASTSFVPAGAQVTVTPAATSAAVTRAPTALSTASSLFGTATPQK